MDSCDICGVAARVIRGMCHECTHTKWQRSVANRATLRAKVAELEKEAEALQVVNSRNSAAATKLKKDLVTVFEYHHADFCPVILELFARHGLALDGEGE